MSQQLIYHYVSFISSFIRKMWEVAFWYKEGNMPKMEIIYFTDGKTEDTIKISVNYSAVYFIKFVRISVIYDL